MTVPILRSEEVYNAVVQIRHKFFRDAISEAGHIKKVQNAAEEAGAIVEKACAVFKKAISEQFPEERDKASITLLLVTQPRLFHLE